MSILGSILSGIFGKSAEAAPAPASAAPTTPAASSTGPSTAPAAAPVQPAAPAPAPAAKVDVAAILDDLTKRSGEDDIDWRKSIVDLMKILKLDSSLKARKQLAQELHYTGSTKNSAELNQWLHKQVMTKLVENGGKLPSDVHTS